MMLRIGIAEDDLTFQGTISSYLKKYQEEHNIEFQTTYFQDGSKLVFKYEPVFDILLLDIEMPKLNGMDAARQIRLTDSRVIIIFITNMAQYAINGYEVGALDFVLKPLKYFSFAMKLEKAITSVSNAEAVSFLVPYKDGVKKLLSDEIIYAEIRDHWLHIFTREEEYKLLSTLKEFVAKTANYHFICCNSCFCINMKYVTDLQKDTVTLDERYELKVSRSKKKEVKQALLDYYKGGLR